MIENYNKEFFDLLLTHIEKVIDENGNDIKYNKLSFKYEKRKYSSVKSIVLYIDDKPCTTYNMKQYKIQYLCRCKRHIIILLQKYIKKSSLNCMHCLQDRSFKEHVETKPYSLKNGERTKEYKKILAFDDMSQEFKDNYINTHIPEKIFFEYLPIIYRLNNVILTDEIRKNIKYKFADYINNQAKFCTKISLDNGKTFSSIKDIAFKCSICNKIFKIHFDNIQKQNINHIVCRTCNFVNHTYKIKLYDNTLLTYQSLLEKDFIDKCYKNNIKILNGFKIPYIFNNKEHTYISDFYLPDFKYIVEIKSNNHFYRNDLKIGKIKAKNKAAKLFAKQNNLHFHFVLDNNDNFIKQLLNKRDSLNNYESN